MGVGEVDQGAEERRQDGVEVTPGGGRDAPGDELGTVFRQPDEAVDVLDELQGDAALVSLTHAQHDRQLGGALADQPDDLQRLVEILLAQAPAEDHAGVGGTGAEGDFRVRQGSGQLHVQLMVMQSTHDILGAVGDDAALLAQGAGHNQHRVALCEGRGQRRWRVTH
ncbi:hypothetical protein D9M71_596320 [compost metagenome]